MAAMALALCTIAGAGTTADDGDLLSGDVAMRRKRLESLSTEVIERSYGHATPEAAADARRAWLDPLRPALVRCTTDPDQAIRTLSGFLLSWVTPDEQVIDALLVLADDPISDARGMGRQGLMSIARASPKARAKVLATLDPSSRDGFAWAAATAELWQLEAAVPLIAKGLESSDVHVQLAAARALAGFGPAGRSAITTLRATLARTPTDDADHRDLRDLVAHAIRALESPPRIEDLPQR